MAVRSFQKESDSAIRVPSHAHAGNVAGKDPPHVLTISRVRVR